MPALELESVQDFASLSAEYDRLVGVLLEHLTEAHLESGDSRQYGWGDEESSRRRLARFPATDDREIWERSQDMRREVSVDVDEYVPFLIEPFEGTDQRLTLWHERQGSITVSMEQVLVAALVKRLRPLTQNWAFAQLEDPDWARDSVQLKKLAGEEQMRLLGALHDPWGKPLGRYRLASESLFDEIDSRDQLFAERDRLISKWRSEVELDPGFSTSKFEETFANRWTTDEADLDGPARMRLECIGLFNADDWSFPTEWIEADRGTRFGQSHSAGQLLFALFSRAASQLEREIGVSGRELMALIDPTWVDAGYPKRVRFPF